MPAFSERRRGPSEQTVEERALANVRPSDDGERRRLLFVLRFRLGEQGDDDVEEVPDTQAVHSGDRIRLALTEGVEAVTLGIVGGVIQLVDGEHGLAPRSPELRGDNGIGLGRP